MIRHLPTLIQIVCRKWNIIFPNDTDDESFHHIHSVSDGLSMKSFLPSHPKQRESITPSTSSCPPTIHGKQREHISPHSVPYNPLDFDPISSSPSSTSFDTTTDSVIQDDAATATYKRKQCRLLSSPQTAWTYSFSCSSPHGKKKPHL